MHTIFTLQILLNIIISYFLETHSSFVFQQNTLYKLIHAILFSMTNRRREILLKIARTVYPQ